MKESQHEISSLGSQLLKYSCFGTLENFQKSTSITYII